MTDDEFNEATQRHADFINSLSGCTHGEVMEVLSHSMASFVSQLDMCCHRGLIEFPSGEKWVVSASSHEADIDMVEINVGESSLVH